MYAQFSPNFQILRLFGVNLDLNFLVYLKYFVASASPKLLTLLYVRDTIVTIFCFVKCFQGF